jgi:hypothetical protein
VEQARDIVVNDTQLETAIVGEDILLTPRSLDAQPDAQSDALLAAGDQSTSLTLQTQALSVYCFLSDQLSVCLVSLVSIPFFERAGNQYTCGASMAVSVQDAFGCVKLRHAGLPHCPHVLLPVWAILECQAVHHLYSIQR